VKSDIIVNHCSQSQTDMLSPSKQ